MHCTTILWFSIIRFTLKLVDPKDRIDPFSALVMMIHDKGCCQSITFHLDADFFANFTDDSLGDGFRYIEPPAGKSPHAIPLVCTLAVDKENTSFIMGDICDESDREFCVHRSE